MLIVSQIKWNTAQCYIQTPKLKPTSVPRIWPSPKTTYYSYATYTSYWISCKRSWGECNDIKITLIWETYFIFQRLSKNYFYKDSYSQESNIFKEKIKCCQIIFISIVCSFLEAIRFPQMVEHEDGASFDNVKQQRVNHEISFSCSQFLI